MAARAKPLATYRQKRHFDQTPEPPPKLPRSRTGHSFVVQKHDASRLHYDFRLELDGVLKSWAVPKGPSLSPGDKRLAMEVEDHPVEYRSFEGVIPDGHYGAGPVIVWDRGSWEPVGDAHDGLRKGHLRFALHGEKLQGEYSLVRLKGRGEKPGKPAWLLFKHTDEFARSGTAAEITHAQPRSVVSGRSIDEVARGVRAPRKAAKKPKRARRRTRGGDDPSPEPGSIEPQLATLVDRVPRGDDLLFEIKYDGYRALGYVRGDDVRMMSRNGLDWTARFGGIARELTRLRLRDAVVDGEVCFVLPDGRTDFQHLQNALRGDGAAQSESLVYFVFDLLYENGVDWRARPLVERRARLERLLGRARGAVRFGEHLSGDGDAILAQACKLGLEGVIVKRGAAPYRSGRSTDWLKVKCTRRQEFVIVGMSAPGGSRSGFGALLLAVREGSALKYAGKVGTGFSQRSLQELSAQLAQLRVEAPPVANPPRERGVTWVAPKLICEVSFTEFTRDGILRHPSFEGLREDKTVAEVKRERARPAGKVVSGAKRAKASTESETVVGGRRISNAQRVMDPASGVTKGDLARYHETVAPLLLPYAKDRPLALVRCPDGSAKQCFFQKHALPGLGQSVGRAAAGKDAVIFVSDVAGVLELVQFNCVEFHGWGSRLPDAERPDWLVFDFDPDVGLPFARVVDAALEIKEELAALDLESWVKTTGGKGLHVVVPLAPRLGWDEIRAFTEAIAQGFAQRDPKSYVATMSKAARKGRIFVDYLRNGRGATAILPYSPRARPGATVAMPVAWRDLRKVDPQEYTVKSVPAMLKRRRKDPWAELLGSRQRLSEKLSRSLR